MTHDTERRETGASCARQEKSGKKLVVSWEPALTLYLSLHRVKEK